MSILSLKARIAAMAVILAVITAVYLPGLSGPLFFDDHIAIIHNPHLNIDGAQLDDWRTASLSSDSGPLRRPIPMATIVANFVLAGGIDSAEIKAVNLMLHLVCGVLVYLVARTLMLQFASFRDPSHVEWAALLAAVLWLSAPLHVSTVLYAVQRMAQLATLFSLAALLLFVRRRIRWADHGTTFSELLGTALWLALIWLLALLSKENTLLLPWLLVVAEIALFRGRWEGRRRAWLQSAGVFFLFLPIAVIALVLWWQPQAILGGYAYRDFTLSERVLTQGRLLWQYLAWLTVPDISSMGFHHDDILLSQSWMRPFTTAVAAVAWVLVLVVAIMQRNRAPLFLFAVLAYLVGHVLESSIWPLEMVYEHRNYLPSVGVLVFFGAALCGLVARFETIRPRMVVAVALAVFSTCLFLRVQVWAEPVRLATVNLENHPDSSRTQYYVAKTQLDAYVTEQSLGAAADLQKMQAHLLRARHHLELMYLNNRQSLAAIVLLYVLDSAYFPTLAEQNNWLERVAAIVEQRPLQPSDINGLDSLVDCYTRGECPKARATLLASFDTLEQRQPAQARYKLLRYRMLKYEKASHTERLAALREAEALDPGDTTVYQNLIFEYNALGDMGSLYRALQRWMVFDPARRQLGVMEQMFRGRGAAAPVAELQ